MPPKNSLKIYLSSEWEEKKGWLEKWSLQRTWIKLNLTALYVSNNKIYQIYLLHWKWKWLYTSCNILESEKRMKMQRVGGGTRSHWWWSGAGDGGGRSAGEQFTPILGRVWFCFLHNCLIPISLDLTLLVKGGTTAPASSRRGWSWGKWRRY